MLLSRSTRSSAVYQCFPVLDIMIWESFALVVREVSVCSPDKGAGVPYIAILGIGSRT